MKAIYNFLLAVIVLLITQISFAQVQSVSGVVTDLNGVPIPCANVVVQGSKTGTQTDVDGKYSIKAKAGDVLVFSFVGMADATAKVGASNTVNVKMQDGVNLEEVIVGAMGIKRTKDATVSAQKQIGAAELTQANNPNAVAALTGKVSGLTITGLSGGVSPNLRIVLRGARTITGNNEALVVIDNVISSANNLQLLQPDAIENVNVIKGAQTAFNDGVADDFNRKVATMGTYLTTINTKPNFGYSAAFTTAQKLHAIMFQKWIALMGVNAIESYIDYTRTGYPLTPLSTVTTKTRKPYRLIYPTSEYVANSGNVPNVVEADVFAINAFTPFWKR